MLFNSAIFLLFLGVLLPLYALTPRGGARRWLLLVASYLFYAHWDPRFVTLLLLSTIVDFEAGRRIHERDDPVARRGWLLLSLAVNLGVLAVFKYGRLLLGTVGLDASGLPAEIPVGISFYTFQTLSYTIDIYRRNTSPCQSRLDFALYVSFFAQLVAGPIVRAGEFLPQVRPLPDAKLGDVAVGFQRFTLGLFKKVVIADNVGLFVDSAFLTPGRYDAVVLWCAAYGFALQIYMDFSGYTDMALGVARMFGLKLPENFDAPYLSRSITEFWRRWHMSLSRWLRDYLYIPLGGSRRSTMRTYVNLMATMLLGGLWHGASWTFVVWGAFHGGLLAIERALGVDATGERRGGVARLARVVLVFHLVCVGWVVFRSRSFPMMHQYLVRMLSEWEVGAVLSFAQSFALDWNPATTAASGVLWVRVMLALALLQWWSRRVDAKRTIWDRLPGPIQGVALFLLLAAAALLHVDEVAFIYFQF